MRFCVATFCAKRRDPAPSSGGPPMDTEKSERPPTWLELERALPLPEVQELTGLSRDSLTRHHRDKIVQLTPRRCGMKLRDVLTIVNGK
jgi:hypothetical protein